MPSADFCSRLLLPFRNAFRASLIAVCLMAMGVSVAGLQAEEKSPPTAATTELVELAYRHAPMTDYEAEQCKLDLYLPAKSPAGGRDGSQTKDGNGGFATIVWLHGGGIVGGNRKDKGSRIVAERFVREGYAVASVEYRLSPKVKFPAYLEDVAAAVAYIHQNISQYGGDPNRIYLAGHSAGGYLAAMVGSDPRWLAPHGLEPTDLAGCIPISGQMFTHFTVRKERGIPQTRPMIDDAAPTWHITGELPPFLVIAGGKDMPTRAEENRFFASALKAAKHQNSQYLEVSDRDHGSIVNKMNEADDPVAAAILTLMTSTSPR